MTTATWLNGAGGDWTTAADWSGGARPGSADTAAIGPGIVATAAWTLTATNESVGALHLDAGAFGTLSASGVLLVGGGVGIASGVLGLQAGASLATSGAVTLGAVGSAGTITLGAGALLAAASLDILGNSQLDLGTGAVALGNGAVTGGSLIVGGNASLSAGTGSIVGIATIDGALHVMAPQAGEAGTALLVAGELVDNGSIEVAAGAGLAVQGALWSFATLQVDAFAGVGITGDLKQAGGLLSLGAGSLLLATGTLDLHGTVLATGARIDAGTLALHYDTTIDGGSIDVRGTGDSTVIDHSALLRDGAILQAGSVAITGAPLVALNAATLASTGVISVGDEPGTYSTGGPAPTTLSATAGSMVSAAQGLSLIGGGAVSLDAGSMVLLGGGTAAAGALVVGGGGTLTADLGLVQAAVVDNGAIDVVQSFREQTFTPLVEAGDLTVTGSLTGSGAIHIGTAQYTDNFLDVLLAHGTLEVASAAGFAGTVMLDSGATLMLDTGGAPGALVSVKPVTGDAGAATIDLRGLSYAAFNLPLYNAATGSLSIGGDTLDVGLNHLAGDFATAPDSGTGTLVSVTGGNPCYVAGTRIATPAGHRNVEHLRAGDLVLVQRGGALVAEPVRWVGRFTVDLDRHPAPLGAAPIRLRAGSVADWVPARDLLLSPDHAVLVGGVLVQAQALLNGATVLREPAAGQIIYVHVELDRHGILLAEGMPAESYLDTGNRGSFAGEAGARALHPDLSAPRDWHRDACAELVLTGPRVAAAHAGLLKRALALGWEIGIDPALRLLLDDGCEMRPARLGEAGWQAVLPAGEGTVRLRSRSFVPDEQDRAAGDRRRLGVPVAAITLAGRSLPDCAYRGGWHAPEPDWRWTDGDALLRLRPSRRPRMLRIDAAAMVSGYWRAPVTPPSPTPAAWSPGRPALPARSPRGARSG